MNIVTGGPDACRLNANKVSNHALCALTGICERVPQLLARYATLARQFGQRQAPLSHIRFDVFRMPIVHVAAFNATV